MSKGRVLITTLNIKPGDEADRGFQEAGFETVFNPWRGGRTEDGMIAMLQGIDGAIVGIDPMTKRVLSGADRLKVVARAGVGYETVDVEAATARGIVVTSNPGVNRYAVAEWAFSLLLSCSRKIVENLSEVRQGGWKRHQGHDLMGSTLGIVGLGAIGKELAVRARAFGMRVLAHDLVQDTAFAAWNQVSYVSLEQLLTESDYVSLHLFLDERSRHLINAERLAMMKPTAYLINTCRGGVVDTEALCQALREGRIAGAALDVFEEEPLGADSPLRQLDNIYMSPHAAGTTAETQVASGRMAAENVLRVLTGQRPLHAVNPEVLK